jgi:hypothetical protein
MRAYASRFPGTAIRLSVALALATLGVAHARKLSVGPGKTYAAPCAASTAAKDGDTVEIDPGVYSGDVCGWTVSNLVLRGSAAYAHLSADGKAALGKGTWVIQGNNTIVEDIEFSGASVPDQNGAGIRQEGENLTVRHCFFHDNENGILTGSAAGDVLIESSIFADNGFGDGYSHNMYIGNTRSFTLRYCFTHHAKVGHDVKTRALSNRILYNRISDESDGTASYELDMPDGGSAIVLGNVIQQGAASQNPTILTYGEESLKNPSHTVYVVNNTFVNDLGRGTFISLAAGADAHVLNNLFAGAGTPIGGKADTLGNVAAAAPGFINPSGFDYRLASTSPALDKGDDPGVFEGFSLTPTFEYAQPAAGIPRPVTGALDAGAYEFGSGDAVRPGAVRNNPPRIRPGRGFEPIWISPSGDLISVLGRRTGSVFPLPD